MAKKEDGLAEMKTKLTDVSLTSSGFEEIVRRIEIIEAMTK